MKVSYDILMWRQNMEERGNFYSISMHVVQLKYNKLVYHRLNNDEFHSDICHFRF